MGKLNRGVLGVWLCIGTTSACTLLSGRRFSVAQ
jgi:hypothetical protein